MALTPFVKTLIILNNYFHDVATAMLLASALVVWMLGARAAADGDQASRWFAGSYGVLSKIARWSLVWIVIGGIPRAIFFQQVEWNLSDPSNKYLFVALMVKHALMWVMVIGGAVVWRKMKRVASRYESEQPSMSAAS